MSQSELAGYLMNLDVLYTIVHYCTLFYSVVQCCTEFCSILQCCTVFCTLVQCWCTVMYTFVQCCTLLYTVVHIVPIVQWHWVGLTLANSETNSVVVISGKEWDQL